MSCNSCAKAFSLIRKEKGCPGCGFSYCSKCLVDKVHLPKLNAEAKVCAKCKKSLAANERKNIEPPDAYYKRIGAIGPQQPNISSTNSNATTTQNRIDQEILNRLQKLKEVQDGAPETTDLDIAQRLQKIKGEIPSTSDAELRSRLAKLKGTPELPQNKPALLPPDPRTEQEQANDLMKQYLEEVKVDTKYKDDFDNVISDIEQRMHRLKDKDGIDPENKGKNASDNESEDEDEIVKKLIEKAKAESLLEAKVSPGQSSEHEELPFCEICNEDAQMRCLGCRYLYCKQCFMEHKEDDDGCNRYEPYKPPKGCLY